MLHPFDNREMTPLENTLWRMRMVAHEVHEILRGFEATGDVAKALNSHLLFTISNHALLLCAKFLETWDDLGALAKGDGRIIVARKAVQPLIDRLLVWEGLRDYRNTIIAHSYLDKKDNLIGPWDLIEQRKVPTYHAEVAALLHVVILATAGILMVFSKEYLPITPALAQGRGDPEPGPGISLGTDVDGVIRPLAEAVGKNLEEAGVKFVPFIANEFRISDAP